MATPTTAAVAAAVAAVLAGVSGIGRVNEYDRYFTDETSFKGFHQSGEVGALRINSATITTAAVRPLGIERDRSGSGYGFEREREVQVKLIRGQHDAEASQHILADLAVAVVDALSGAAARASIYAALDGAVYDTPSADPIGLAGYGAPQPFILVNQAVITLTLREPL